MLGSRPEAAPLDGAARSRLLLWLTVLAVGLSLLAMHQLSGNHTAANSRISHQSVTVQAGNLRHHAAGHAVEAGTDHAHLVPMADEGGPTSGDGGCPDCAGHSAMALTCLAALSLLATGLLLPPPRTGRGISATAAAAGRPQPPQSPQTPTDQSGGTVGQPNLIGTPCLPGRPCV